MHLAAFGDRSGLAAVRFDDLLKITAAVAHAPV